MYRRQKYLIKLEKYLKVVNSIFLVWSRQVWKTSIMKSLIDFDIINKEKTFYINFDEIMFSADLKFENIFLFINYIEFNYNIKFNEINYFLFDEVKNIKNFNIIIKSLIDRYQDKKFICTSSWNYEWTNDIIEWLAWRSLKINVYPLDFEEFLQFKWKALPNNIDENLYNSLSLYLSEYITFWWYPQVVLSSWKQEKLLVLKSIVDSVFLVDIKQFIKQEKIIEIQKIFTFMWTNIWNPFSLEWISSYIWEKNYNIKLFLDVLEKNFLIFKLNTFNTNKRNELKWKFKIYLSDFWIMNYFLKRYDVTEFSWDYIEMLVFINLFYNLNENDTLSFWQNLNKNEIDFILEKSWKIIPIEVKSWNNDTIPKIFNSFYEIYNDKIDYFIKTTKFLSKIREKDNKKIIFQSFINTKIF